MVVQLGSISTIFTTSTVIVILPCIQIQAPAASTFVRHLTGKPCARSKFPATVRIGFDCSEMVESAVTCSLRLRHLVKTLDQRIRYAAELAHVVKKRTPSLVSPHVMSLRSHSKSNQESKIACMYKGDIVTLASAAGDREI